jgi:tRNA G10  N-methylase Trm11
MIRSRIIAALSKIGAALPSETRRSEESQSLQQISTPLELAYVASLAARIVPGDVVLEPSAGTGPPATRVDFCSGRRR